MYNVSEAYLAAMQSAVQVTRLTFTVNNVAYTEDNILQGTFKITNQCTDTSDITLGAVYVGELTATLRGVNIPRNSWRGVTIVPTFHMLTDADEDTWESVPLGIYVVQEASWSASGVDIKAYDNMRLLDRRVSMSQTAGYLYDFLVVLSQDCGITLGQTEQQIKALPNGNVYFRLFGDNDIDTYRDLLSWIAQTSGGFATINRAGELEIRTYGQTAVDTLDRTGRLRGAIFSDYVTSYTGLSYVDMASKTTKYYSVEADTGATMNLGQNPFLQDSNTTAISNLLECLSDITYVPFKAQNSVRDISYDLGDVIAFTDGLAGTESICCIQRYEYNLHRTYTMQGYGSDPAKASAKSKTDKNIAGLLAESNANEMQFYEYRNVTRYNIGNNERKQIVRMKLASKIETRAQVHISINLGSQAIEDYTIATVTYMIDGYEEALHPEETYIDGNHVLHLMYILNLSANVNAYFIVYMKAQGGTIAIERQGVWVFVSGLGLVGDSKWDGTFDIFETAEPISIIDVDVAEDVAEDVTIGFLTPTVIAPSDIAENINLVEVSIDSGIAEDVRITMRYEEFERVTEDGEERVLEDAETVRYTEA